MIFVTGGTGLVGTHLLYDLTRSGQKVRALKRPNSNIAGLKKIFSWYSPDAEALIKNIEWVDADLLDVYSLSDVMEGVTHIYHCAAMVSFEKKHEAQMMKINVDGTANMVNAALEKGVHKFMHVSSIATLGRTEHGEHITEQTFWKSSPDNSIYSISKYGAEREVWRASEEGLNMMIVNPSLIIGPGNWNQSTCNMFSKGYKGIRYYTGGVNGFIDVRDVTALMIRLMDTDISSERFLLNAENQSFRYFFDRMHENFGKKKPSVVAGPVLSGVAWRMEKLRSMITGAPPLITPETARSAHRIMRFSNEKIKALFPDHLFIPLEKSVKDTCEKFLKDIKRTE
jgi:dihydroflavonol-4-reductase